MGVIGSNETDKKRFVYDREALENVCESLKALGLKRVPIETFKDCFYKLFTELLDHPDRNQHLRAFLDQLADSAFISYPSETRRNWSSSRPKLPYWFTVREHVSRSPIDPYSVAWVDELAFCLHLKNRAQIEAAIQINEYLIHKRDALQDILPIRERSLEIFGDEKRLDGLVKDGKLLGGQLELAALGAVEIAPPVPCEYSGDDGKRIIVVENHNTYWSICRWNAEVHVYSAIAWGNGNVAVRNIEGIAQVVNRARAGGVDYFGDIDLRGLEIMHSVTEKLKAQFKIDAAPAHVFYDWLLQNGRRCPAGTVPEVSTSTQFLAPFTEQLRVQFVSLLNAGLRIPQEALNGKVLKQFS